MKSEKLRIKFWTIFFILLFFSNTYAFSLNPIKFYQKHISPVDGDRCPMHPSCSSYSLEAAKKHNPFMAWIMISDRLTRCGGDEVYESEIVDINGRKLCLDPVSNNDFWWYDNEIIENNF